jgi:hypothetical protein
VYRRDSSQSKNSKVKEQVIHSSNGSEGNTQSHLQGMQGDRERKTDSDRLSVTLPSMALNGKYNTQYCFVRAHRTDSTCLRYNII